MKWEGGECEVGGMKWEGGKCVKWEVGGGRGECEVGGGGGRGESVK